MPTTPTYALPYPALSDPPNGAGQMQSLAEQVESTISATDSRVSTLESDTAYGAWQTLSLLNGWTHRTGYYVPGVRTCPGNEGELVGGLISGTSANGTVIANLPAGIRPTSDTPLPLLANNGEMYAVFLRTTGEIELFHSQGTSPSFNAIYLMGTFPLSR